MFLISSIYADLFEMIQIIKSTKTKYERKSHWLDISANVLMMHLWQITSKPVTTEYKLI